MISNILDHSGRPFNRNGDAKSLTDEYGSFPLPQILTYSAVLSSGGYGKDRSFYHNAWDEAVKHSREDALVMRRDAFLMSLLQERKLAVASIPWELEVPNEKDPRQKLVRDTLKTAIEGISDLRRIMYALLEATWYGRYAVEFEWEWQQIQGGKVMTVCDWVPINGDKLGWTFGGVPYILVNPALMQDTKGIELINTNAGGMGMVLKGTWRNRFVIHRHEMDDGDYFEPEAAAGVWGVGIRSRIFWLDWIRREYMEWITTFLERVGLGVTLWYYDGGNQQALDAVQKAAKEQSRRANLFVPIFTDGKGSPKGLVERIETPVNGVDALRLLKEDIEQKIERFVVGQEASSKSDGATGLGNAQGAKFQMSTKSYITKFDAQNLAETLTGNKRNPGLVYLMQRWSFPDTMPDKEGGFRVKWKFGVEEEDSDKKLEAIGKVVSFGIAVKADEARAAAGLSKPDPGDELIQPQGPGGAPGGTPVPGALPSSGAPPASADQGGSEEQDRMLGVPMSPEEEAESVLGSEAAMYQRDLGHAVSEAAKETDSNPSEDQKKSGNYRKGKVRLHGMEISIENPRGSFRSGKNKAGKEWRTEMKHHYGYIKSTESEADGDHIDVFIGPHPESEMVFVIDQVRPDSGRFDEHKCMLGFFSEADAKKGYLDCYEKGWKGIDSITPMTMDQFREWIEHGQTGERAAEQFARAEWSALYRAAPGEDVQAPHPTPRAPKAEVSAPSPDFASVGHANQSANAGDWVKDIGPHGGLRWINRRTGEKAYASSGRNPTSEKGGGAPPKTPEQQAAQRQQVIQRKKLNGQALAKWYANKWNLLTELGMKPEEYEMDEAGLEIYGSGVALWHDEDGSGEWHVIPLDEAEEKPEEDVLPEQNGRRGEPAQYIYKPGQARAPADGVLVGGRFYRGGSFVPKDAAESGSPVRAQALHQTAREKHAVSRDKRTSRGPIDEKVLKQKLAAHRGAELEGHEMKHAEQAYKALHRHHGEMVLHRVEELADDAHRVLATLPEGSPLRGKFEANLRSLSHMVDMHKREGRMPVREKPEYMPSAAQETEAAKPAPPSQPTVPAAAPKPAPPATEAPKVEQPVAPEQPAEAGEDKDFSMDEEIYRRILAEKKASGQKPVDLIKAGQAILPTEDAPAEPLDEDEDESESAADTEAFGVGNRLSSLPDTPESRAQIEKIAGEIEQELTSDIALKRQEDADELESLTARIRSAGGNPAAVQTAIARLLQGQEGTAAPGKAPQGSAGVAGQARSPERRKRDADSAWQLVEAAKRTADPQQRSSVLGGIDRMDPSIAGETLTKLGQQPTKGQERQQLRAFLSKPNVPVAAVPKEATAPAAAAPAAPRPQASIRDILKRQAEKRAKYMPAAESRTKPEGGAFSPGDHVGKLVEAVNKHGGAHNMADMTKVRSELSGLTREQQDAVIAEAMKQDQLSGAGWEGRGGITPEQQGATYKHAKMGPGEPGIGYLQKRQKEPVAAVPKEAQQLPDTIATSALSRMREAASAKTGRDKAVAAEYAKQKGIVAKQFDDLIAAAAGKERQSLEKLKADALDRLSVFARTVL